MVIKNKNPYILNFIINEKHYYYEIYEFKTDLFIVIDRNPSPNQ